MYLKWGKINATLPKDADHEKLTLEQAIEIIKARAEQMGVSTAKKAPAKKGKKATTKAAKPDSEETASEPAKKTAAKKKPAAKKK